MAKAKTAEEDELLACYERVLSKREQLQKIKTEKANEKKNLIPMIKKYNDKKTYTKQELASCVANASSATARAKLLMQSGKLVLKAGQSQGFKRRAGVGRNRQRPIDVNDGELAKRPRVNLPMYADDDPDDLEETTNVDRYANIPTGEEDLKPNKSIPKILPVTKNKIAQRRNEIDQRKPQNHHAVKAFNTMQSQRKQVVYDEDPF